MIVVFGSINMDMYLTVEHFPDTGETVVCPGFEQSPGGKGANQALAAARGGAKVALVGRVGDDNMGLKILNNVRRGGVMTSGVSQSNLPTGCAFIMRDPTGGSRTIVASGANADLSADQVPDEILHEKNIILLQMEVPPEENWNILRRAKEKGAMSILNLAPAIKIPQEALDNLDILIVNLIEARQIAEKLGLQVETDAIKLAQALSRQGNLTCIVTIGSRGAVAWTKDGKSIAVGALKLEEEVDVTGAGDAYCGTIAACLHEGMSLDEAMRRASVAGSLTCMTKGAQISFPYMGDIEARLDEVGPAIIQ